MQLLKYEQGSLRPGSVSWNIFQGGLDVGVLINLGVI